MPEPKSSRAELQAEVTRLIDERDTFEALARYNGELASEAERERDAWRDADRESLALGARYRDRALDAEAKIRAVEELLDDDDDRYAHVHILDQGQGEPDCARCWTDDIRAALSGGEA